MKIDPWAPAFPCDFMGRSGLPIRLELAARFEAALLANLAAIRGAGFGDDELEEFALIRADSLIAAYNGSEP